ncbi:hypothetical protein MT996_01875 [Ornithobacterium rhinotracheale]|uniref:hypothetical protein n=1 Tax=Ornithobacterium rhinotracheale TaxID=28251 RepID=UPI00129D046F|nr:hypothetical protein [Ornithobacterium rhinotracheale]UOH78232.1 hypothetical protein MT996_01875 [Ornithobacterium rhinotracheale]
MSIFLMGFMAGVQAQETTHKTKNGEVKENVPIPPEKKIVEFPVYPGCENLTDNTKMLFKCFGIKFGDDALQFLDTTFPKNADPSKDILRVRVLFKVLKDGTIGEIKPKLGDEIIYDQVVQSIEKLANHLKENGKYIRPAVNALGEKIDCQFTQDFSLSRPKDQKKPKEASEAK